MELVHNFVYSEREDDMCGGFGNIFRRTQALTEQGCLSPLEHMRGNCSCPAKDPGQQTNGSGSSCGCGSACKCEEGKCNCGTVTEFHFEAPTVH